MNRLRRLIAHTAALAILCVCIPLAHATEIHALFLGDNGHHQPKARFNELQPILQDRGIELTYTDTMSDITLENLKRYDALLLFANIDEIAASNEAALLEYVSSGGGFVPLHSASYCFRNSPKLIALMGGQFQRHGTGVFRGQVAEPNHELMRGFSGFSSWDETYVHHRHNDADRIVLEYRVDEEGREPYTWIRTQGQGRVFYTAWGHDSKTWANPGFQNLVERGIRWAAGDDPQNAGPYRERAEFPVPEMTNLPADLKPFEYVDVGREIPNYTPSDRWGVQGEPMNLMQEPLEPEESMKHFVVPRGFHVELFASEPDLGGKPICMAWDERGRLWVAETIDYPNELQPPGKGRDRIRICEDTDKDGKADKFTVFAEDLSIPTSITFYRGGAIIQNAVETLYLKDNDGDDRADQRTVLFSNWQLGDTHGGVSNFQYGLDNWIWAMQGYNDSQPVANGESQQRFRMGFFRMQPDGSKIEFIRSTNNNTWGLGISEEGLIFGSTANGNPSIFMPIANRYYEHVRGWATSLTLSSIADTNDFDPITDKVRQVDHHGGYTAAAGHALYTGRAYPQEYWNRVAFVNGPTGHLVGSFILSDKGSDFHSTSPFNLLASDDEWSAPIMAEVGPDGQVWVIDWYNYIVQHNPTPEGFQTGKGKAYESKLRDKKHGRIYRVVADDTKNSSYPDLGEASPAELVAALTDPTMLVRKHAQRLLVESGNQDVLSSLISLIEDDSVDAIGLNVGAIHALWTLHGLGLLDGSNERATQAAIFALKHPSAGVRRNAAQVLPPTTASVQSLLSAKLHRDPNAHVRLAATLALADLPACSPSGEALLEMLANHANMQDRWIPDAITSAAAHNSSYFLESLASVKALPTASIPIITRVAEHHARGQDNDNLAQIVAGLGNVDPKVVAAVIQGLQAGWKGKSAVTLTSAIEADLKKVFDHADTGTRATLTKLAIAWGSETFDGHAKQLCAELLSTVRDEDATDVDRVKAAEQLIAFRPEDEDAAVDLLDEVSPRISTQLASGLLGALEASRWNGVGSEIVSRLGTLTPSLKQAALSQLLKRPASTMALLEAAQEGEISLNELALDQRQALSNHPDPKVKELAAELLAKGGSLPNADRQRVLDSYMVSTEMTGDAVRGKAIFLEHCSKCHVHGSVGTEVGPNLTGMAVHPKKELLTHILDPSRSVEGNFRAYTVLTVDGLVINGMLASESKTSIELFDTAGKRQGVLREDIEELVMSRQSIMPEGFENTIPLQGMTDLLEFLTAKGQYVPIPLGPFATAISTQPLFGGPDNGPDRLVFADWKIKMHRGIPFQLVDPQGKTKPNIILLHGPHGPLPPKMPKSVSLPCNSPIKAIHLLSGVGGWSYPANRRQTVSMIVRLRYHDGMVEDHELMNGVHFADYIRRVDVPQSEFAFALGEQQIRYLSIIPNSTNELETIELVKGDDSSAPIVMAVTIESHNAPVH
ncbi:PVC-type heme-binding CxxCH protein [Aporhodopirellula aestuarii]|uniref:ThuA domain-containing protein n=1 Tax=Aporhodopirellula aestuarii TaxID=2950107 RepID=A0ABT0U8D3_9BACT|nr:PVC-type heme-binding CxxCH protein [Aporhodopirellula aestuarii]MCM2372611.1 ThuA domain-containing protein [Aporhodopirellula aestuarii]